jgi:hypothetical protein
MGLLVKLTYKMVFYFIISFIIIVACVGFGFTVGELYEDHHLRAEFKHFFEAHEQASKEDVKKLFEDGNS